MGNLLLLIDQSALLNNEIEPQDFILRTVG